MIEHRGLQSAEGLHFYSWWWGGKERGRERSCALPRAQPILVTDGAWGKESRRKVDRGRGEEVVRRAGEPKAGQQVRRKKGCASPPSSLPLSVIPPPLFSPLLSTLLVCQIICLEDGQEMGFMALTTKFATFLGPGKWPRFDPVFEGPPWTSPPDQVTSDSVGSQQAKRGRCGKNGGNESFTCLVVKTPSSSSRKGREQHRIGVRRGACKKL